MAKARKILARTKAIRSIYTVTRTMEMVATARFKRAHNRAVAARDYIDGIAGLTDELLTDADSAGHPLLRPASRGGKRAMLVLASDRGLCGGYNAAIVHLAGEELAKREARHVETDLMAAGKKAISMLKQAGRQPSRTLPTYDAAGGSIWHEVSSLADEMMNQLYSRDIRGLDVVFGEMRGGGSQRPTVRRILPLVEPDEPDDETVEEADARYEADRKKQEEEDRWAPYEPYAPLDPYEPMEAFSPPEPPEFEWDFYPSSRVVLQRLLPTTVRLRLFQCFLEAAVTEQIARMASMRSASDNAEEMIKDLTVQYNRSRQGQITTELAEILGGTAAIE